MLRLGVVGCGAVCEHHLAAITSRGLPVHLAACVDEDVSRATHMAQRYGDAGTPPTVHAALHDLLQDDGVDTVAVLVPHDLHMSFALAVLSAGRNLVLEKPIAATAVDCDAIVAAAEAAAARWNTTCLVAENSGYWPEMRAAAGMVAAGDIGDVVTASSHYTEVVASTAFAADTAAQVASWLGWRKALARAGGGVCLDGGLHWLRPLRMCMAEPVAAVAAATHRTIEAMEGESLARALLEFPSGRVATFAATVLETGQLAPTPWLHVTGTRGEIVVHNRFDGGLSVHTADCPDGHHMEPQGYFASFPPMWEDFVAVLLGHKPTPAFGLHEAVTDLRVVLALYKAAATRQWVDVHTPPP